jgi:hypothetical protein
MTPPGRLAEPPIFIASRPLITHYEDGEAVREPESFFHVAVDRARAKTTS